VEVLGIQKLALASLEPLSPGQRLAFGTVAIGAGVVSVALMAAVVTLLQMAARTAVRQTSIAVMTRCCAMDIEAPFCRR
jgi:hypothetical protein